MSFLRVGVWNGRSEAKFPNGWDLEWGNETGVEILNTFKKLCVKSSLLSEPSEGINCKETA